MPRPAKLPIVRFLNSIWLLNWSTAVIWCFPINAVGKCSKLDTNQLEWCCFINFVFQADLHGLSFLTLRDGPPTVTDRTDQEFSGPIGSKLHLRRLHPTNYICTKYFSAFLRSLAIFLAFWHFPQYFPSPFHCSCLKSKSVSIFPTWLFPWATSYSRTGQIWQLVKWCDGPRRLVTVQHKLFHQTSKTIPLELKRTWYILIRC